jgi:predicted KAP-like P-loop ATPase
MSDNKSLKEKTLEQLNFVEDQPDLTSEMFNFRNFVPQLSHFLCDIKTPTPFTIGLHGEWDGGKTSLLYRVYTSVTNDLRQDSSRKKWKTIWFDAWEYERLDPTLALMQKIELKYSDHNKKRTKQILTGTLLAFSDIALKTYAGIDLQRVKRYYKSSVEQISTISEQLKKAIGNDGRLIVFIDDPDRCMIDNVLSMLEAIKLFLTVRVIFILALDMSKIERAWELRYHGYPSASQESKDHIEKIFQLEVIASSQNNRRY